MVDAYRSLGTYIGVRLWIHVIDSDRTITFDSDAECLLIRLLFENACKRYTYVVLARIDFNRSLQIDKQQKELL